MHHNATPMRRALGTHPQHGPTRTHLQAQQHSSHEAHAALMRGALSRQRVLGQRLARDEAQGGPLVYSIEVHAAVTGLVRGQHPSLVPAPTRVSDSEGIFVRDSIDGTSGMLTLVGRNVCWVARGHGPHADRRVLYPQQQPSAT